MLKVTFGNTARGRNRNTEFLLRQRKQSEIRLRFAAKIRFYVCSAIFSICGVFLKQEKKTFFLRFNSEHYFID